jgi:ribonuclease-3
MSLWQRIFPQTPRDTGTGLEERIAYRFQQPELLEQALTHRSHVGQVEGAGRLDSNERLEFLGDAVLDLCISRWLYHNFPGKKEGELTKYKSIIVSGRFLVQVAMDLGLGDYLLLSDSEDRSGGRRRPSILEDAFESLIGALYLDGGIKAAEAFVDRFILDGLDLQQASRDNRNYKSLLLELSQGKGLGNPVYQVVEELGPDHSKFFVVEVLVNGQSRGRGTGSSKKKAEQAAAREGLASMKASGMSQ